MAIRKPIILLAVLILLWGCRAKEEPTPLIVGDWLWTISSGGIGGWTLKPVVNQRTVLRFTRQGTFNFLRNDTLLVSGNYKLGTGHSIYTGKNDAPIIETSNETVNGVAGSYVPHVPTGSVINQLDQTTLSIGDNYYDGYGSEFKRQ